MNPDQNTSPNEGPGTEEIESQRSNTRMMIVIGVVVLIILILGGWLFFGGKSSDDGDDRGARMEESDESIPESAGDAVVVQPTTAANGEALVVSNQSAGNTVLVTSAVVNAPSWITVREEGWILGAARIEESGTNIVVPLLRGTEAGNNYEVVIYVDNGDRQFDHLSDVLVEGVSAPFVAE